jgi:peptidoglycan/xylan/chitin deacetylase (PgdA/CDA1 family)
MPATSRYPRPWAWPGDAKIAMSIGLAFEAFQYQSQYSHDAAKGSVNHFSISYADYGWKSGVWRLLDLLDEVGLKASMSTNGLAAERLPGAVRDAAEAGHEIVGHGWVNDRLMQDDDPEAELAEIRRCTSALTEAADVRPIGWTSPGSMGSKNTLAFLRAEGYLWNGDDASDDLPFIHHTEHGPMVIMPRVNIPQNDLIMWMRPRNPPSILLDGFRETFDQLYAEGQAGSPKWIEMTLHCHIAGRPTLIPTIRRCIEYAKRHEGVWYARKRDIAAWALEREGKAATGARPSAAISGV